MSSKLLVVFGATGNQGSSVINSILNDPVTAKEYKIRAITRDASKPAAQKLAERGVEVAVGDMDSKDSLRNVLKGADTVFSVTNFWEKMSREVETTQGKNVADVAKEFGVKHLIWSGLYNVTEISGGRFKHVIHFDGKHDVEVYIRNLGIPATFFYAGLYMSNGVSIQKGEDGEYTLGWPVTPETKFPLFAAAEDTGKFVKAMIKSHAAGTLPNGSIIYGATDYYTPTQIVEQFTEVTGAKAKYVQLSGDVFKGHLPEALRDELYENFLFVQDYGYYKRNSLGESLAILEEKPTTWKEFVSSSSVFASARKV